MSKGLLFALTTLIGFATGIVAGMWIQRHQPVPAAPTGVLGEVRDVPLAPAKSEPKKDQPKSPPRDQAAINRINAEIEAFKKRVEPIKTEFREKLSALLTPEQRERLMALTEQAIPSTQTNAAGATPPAPSRRSGFDSTVTIVLVPITLEKLSEDLKLEEAQKPQVLQLLLERRAKFLALVDAMPPPSWQLGKVAPATSGGSK
jgi:hypothetical protein